MYDFEAGDISLDFVNTNLWHASASPEELLHDFADLVEWGLQAGLIDSESADLLNHSAGSNPERSVTDYALAIQFREALYRVYSSFFAGRPVPAEDLAFLNDIATQAMAHLELSVHESKFQWRLPSNLEGANFILWPVARAATNLLTSDTISRLRECEDDRGCGYLFIDTTRNHSRRWCSMESCGNRAKARRHYSRIQAGG